MKKNIEGVCPLVLMPFNGDGEIDYAAVDSILEFLLSRPIHGIGLYGVVSEFYKISDQERMVLARHFIDAVKDSDKYSLVSVTDHCTELAVRRAMDYEAIGADCIMLLPPHFLSPSPEQIKTHLSAVAGAVSIPVMIQYAPNETGRVMSVEELAAIRLDYPNVIYKIENNPPTEYTKMILERLPGVTVMNGYWGRYLLDVLSIGAKGVLPACSFPEIYVQMYDLFTKGMIAEAETLHSRLMSYIEGRWKLNVERMIAIEKEILRRRCVISCTGYRRPAYELTSSDRSDIEVFLTEFSEYLDLK